MTPARYALAIAELIAQLIRLVIGVLNLITTPQMTRPQWTGVLRMVYPHVEAARVQAATLAREMYDTERSRSVPELPRNDTPLVGSTFEEFVQAMEPARRRVSQVETREHAIGMMTREIARQVENAGRRQIIQAVEADDDLAQAQAREEEQLPPDTPLHEPDPEREPDPQASVTDTARPEPVTRIVRGWARVATGRETCAWCLMLISHGPKWYTSAAGAGFDGTDSEAIQMWAAGEDITGSMEEWHPGCDCKAYPVFRKETWQGKEAADRALVVWKRASKEAARLIESGEARTKNLNKEAINVIRRWIYHGQINAEDYAGLAA